MTYYSQLQYFCWQTALKYSEKYGADKVRVLTLAENRGKGGAVRMVCAIEDLQKLKQ